ncbi:hypothetical protein B5M09_004620 [Aphanomyces astaci]|uniref:Uncharacterized protein n=1 Tax=Aphanomyces astaci TaxID=112090 RepID=A0A425CXR0_APHAT|nr:hypothetical protein B5M09_004620 [Aphanomyces astaci]
MDKILQSVGGPDKSISVTNDGATILKSVYIDNAAAKVLVDIAKTQDEEVGDGTTSVAVLCGELLREAEKLIEQRIHPQTIIEGWRIALSTAHKALEKSARDHSQDPIKFREDLLNIARTTLSSKLMAESKDHFAELAVDAVLRLKGSNNLDHIQIIKKQGGSLKNSYLEEGYILDKHIGVGQPKRIVNAKILIANTGMDTDKIKIYGARVKVDSMEKVASIEDAEKLKMRQKRLAAVTGGEITSTFEHPELVTLGEAALIEEIMIGEDRVIRFSGVKTGQACKVLMAQAIDELAPGIPGKKSLAMEAFARALRQIPAIIADNGGYDSAELVTQLRAAHFGGHNHAGLNMANGSIGDMEALGIRESYKSKMQVLLSAAEAAEMILRVDDIVKCAPRQRQG